MSAPPEARARPIELAAAHALAWLAVSCGVGLLLALLLLVPDLGAALAPVTYGRLVPLHLDLALYGWLSLPLVALLVRAYLPRHAAGTARVAAAAVHLWSGCLAAGAAAWLAGWTTGKPFLDWQGLARTAFLAALAVLAGVLAAGLAGRRRAEPASSRAVLAGLAALWLGLLGVPVALAAATSPATYPPVNPATGGPTGASLLGSTLAVVAIVLATPLLLGLRPRDPRRSAATPATPAIIGALAVHGAFFALVAARGDASHREPLQIAAVTSLLVWAGLLPRWLGRFVWPAGSRRWLLAFVGWGAALLATAVPMSLPGLLDRIKFTNALVGHAHLAMAGMASAFAGLVLVVVTRGTRLAGVLDDRGGFALWQAGTALHVATLAAAGALEAADPGVVFRGDPTITALYAARAAAGATMLASALRWAARAAAAGTARSDGEAAA